MTTEEFVNHLNTISNSEFKFRAESTSHSASAPMIHIVSEYGSIAKVSSEFIEDFSLNPEAVVNKYIIEQFISIATDLKSNKS